MFLKNNRNTSQELSSIDVIMCTCNSEKPWFRKCLKAIKKEVPVHCFILVDCYSKDGTVRIVRQYFPAVKIVQTKAKLAQARRMGFELVDTPWFAFFDDDIEPLEGWFRKIVSHIIEDTGAVAGLAIESDSIMEKFTYLRVKDKWIKSRVSTVDKRNPDAMRGLTHDTLCRTEGVKGWMPPSVLTAYEDHHLLRHIVKKGFKWVSVSDAKAKHYGIFTCRSEYKKGKWNGAGARLIRATNLRKLLKKSIYVVLTATYGSVRISNPLVIPISFSYHLGNFVGYLRWNHYLSSYINARI